MPAVNDILQGLKQRKLLPVALLLLGALVAIPFLLSSSEEPAPMPITAAPVAAGGAVDVKPIVAVASEADREVGRDVLGSRKNPFRPAVKAVKGKKASTTTTSSDGGSVTTKVTGSTGGSTGSSSGGSTGGSTGGSAPTGGTGTSNPGINPTTVRKQSYELYQLSVRFGPTSGEAPKPSILRRLKALPSVSKPAVIYLGLLTDGKTAVFLVDSSVDAVGDGSCHPSPEDCQTLHMRAGDTEYLDVKSAEGATAEQFQLDVIKIRKKKTSSASAARRAYTAEAEGGRNAFRARASGNVGRYRFDKRTGKVRLISAKALKAEYARIASRRR
jgi:hypothetical protein